MALNDKISLEKPGDVLNKLNASKDGLSTAEAEARQLKYGTNSIEDVKANPILKLLKYFWGPISWMIEAAALLSLVVRNWPDFILIMILLVANGLISFVQEHKAANAIAALKKQLATKTRVLRDGQWQTLAASELVPGDIVSMHLGDIIPADVYMLEGTNIEIDQSALTGESLPVEKSLHEQLYSGSVITRGSAQGVVETIGENTFFGKTTELVKTAVPTDHFQVAVMRIGRFLIYTTLVLLVAILIDSFIKHNPVIETVQFLLILTVAAIPVALPAVLSVTMAVGAMKLSKLKAIVSRLESIEELAGMDVLCSDKTGTLTENKLKLGEVVLYCDLSKEQLIQEASLACDQTNPDAIDNIILQNTKNDNSADTILSYIPFDPVSKRSEVTVKDGEHAYKITKGAAQVVLELCHQKQDIAEKVSAKVLQLAEHGYRVIAVAKAIGGQWQFRGLLSLSDPLRSDSAETVKAAQALGVDVKMLTGDHLAIANEIGHQIGLDGNIYQACKLKQLNDKQARETVEESDGFAEVFPAHKFEIIKLLQEDKHIVGMTGDGVNDAPALKKADVGIAVAGATDAARSAADVVLTAPGLSVIIQAIQKARQIFQRMNAYAIYRIAETIRILFFLALSILAFNIYPLTAVMIIILALLNDLPIMTIAYDNALSHPKPVNWRMSKVLIISSLLGSFGVISSFILLVIARDVWHLSYAMLQTLMFLKLTASGHMTIYLARTGPKPFYAKPWPSPILFFTTETTQVIGTIFAVYGWLMPAIGWKWALVVWGYSFLEFILNDYVKMFGYRLAKRLKIT